MPSHVPADAKDCSAANVTDVLNAAARLENVSTRNEGNYVFILKAAKEGEGRAQMCAAKFLFEFFQFFEEQQAFAAKVAIGLMSSTEENLRLIVTSNLGLVANAKFGHTKKVADILIQQITSTNEDEVSRSMDQLLVVLEQYPAEVAQCIREALAKEGKERARKAIFRFVYDRMRLVPHTKLGDVEYIEQLENIFHDEFTQRLSLTLVDDLIVYLGCSLIMDDYQRTQRIGNYYIDTIKIPSGIPEFVPEDPVAIAKIPAKHEISKNEKLDKILAQITIIRHMCSLLRQKSNRVNEWFSFLVNNITEMAALPFDRQTRALKALADIAPACSSALDDEVIDQLVEAIMNLVPPFEDPYGGDPCTGGRILDNVLHRKETYEPDPVIAIPEVDFLVLEPVMLAFYRLKGHPYVAEKMANIDIEFRRKMRFMIRCCHVKSTEYKQIVEEIGSVPLKHELNALVAATSNIGLMAIEVLKEVPQWSYQIKPSWKSIWNPKPAPRAVKKIRIDRVKSVTPRPASAASTPCSLPSTSTSF